MRSLACTFLAVLSACASQRPPEVAAGDSGSESPTHDPSHSGEAQPAQSNKPSGEFTDLGEVVLERSLDRALPKEKRYGEGGGMASELMYTRLHWPSLRACRDAIRTVANEWARAHGLASSTVEISDKRMMLHYASSKPPGFFEVQYRVYPEHLATHTYFGFYDSSLRRVAAEAIHEMIEAYELQNLVRDLQTAARCTEGAPL